MGLQRDRFTKKNTAWADWLSDEPAPQGGETRVHVPVSVRDSRATRLRQAGAQPAAKRTEQGGSSVSIQIHLPKIKLPKVKLPQVTRRQIAYWGSLCVVWVGLAVGVRASLELLDKNTGKTEVKGTTTEKSPAFKPLVSNQKTDADNLKQAYDPQRKLVSYNDAFSGAKFTVSQQPLPQKLKDSPAEILKAADTIQAKEHIETALGTLYIGTDEQAGVQRTMLVRKDLLVFIQSSKKLDNDTWKYYVETLR